MRRKPKYTIEEIRLKITPIAERYGVERVYLFGSYATGSARANSDIDFRIDVCRGTDYFKLCEIYCDLEESLKTKIDLLTTGALSLEFLTNIAKEEVLLYAQ